MELIKLPVVTVDGNQYELKLTLGALRRLEQMGVDLADPGRKPTPEEPATQAETNQSFLRLCSQVAAFAHIRTAQNKLRPANLSPDEVMDTAGIEDVGPLQAAVNEALKNAAPNAIPQAETAQAASGTDGSASGPTEPVSTASA